MKRISLILMLVAGLTSTALAQDVTDEPEVPTFALEFPLTHPTDEQLQEAFECALDDSDASGQGDSESPTACALAQQAVALAKAREQDSEPSAEELDLLTRIAAENPALLLDINLIAAYYNAADLVAPPSFADQPITSVSLHYSFGGLGNSLDYTVKITHADDKPVVTGDVENTGDSYSATPEATTEPLTLPDTVDSNVAQALAPALQDLLPTGELFSMTPCWDYYPDWTVILSFADGTVVSMVTQASNVIGIGGPWQVEIDGQTYMQYSGAFSQAVVDLLDALELPLGTTAAMGCGDIDNPLNIAFPDFKSS